ncbi:MarR family winged helix-turn-helix transcriptional regulator [Tateyamaria sp.]|uniref:MarR family winged helix-turn-helix transcriptional regulator n=1 Tax=Tateyamaria sp. TaxID=1929288 RepID=UPI00329D3ADA
MTQDNPDAPLSDFLPFLLFQAAELSSRNFQHHYQSRYGMLRTEWRVMFHLGSTGDQTAKQICNRASLHKTKVSRAVKALEEKRFLKRDTISTDRRSEQLCLTKQGKAVFADLTHVATDFDQRLEQSLGTQEHERLVATLQKLIALHQ